MAQHRRVSAAWAARERDKIARALAAVGLNGFENRGIGTLSGGQMQRMLFARVLLQDARLIVLDEPFNAIDAKTSADLMALVARWHAEQRTVLAALHDMDLVRAPFSGHPAAGARAGGLGPDGRGADARQSRRTRGGCARPSTSSAAACAIVDPAVVEGGVTVDDL